VNAGRPPRRRRRRAPTNPPPPPPPPPATVVRYGDRLPLAAAAFINSTFGQAFEKDDLNPLVRGHPGAKLVPSLLAVAERDHVCGREFLTAFVAAYEVRGRIGWSLSPEMMTKGGPHFGTTCGPFGVAAGVARLLGLGADGICNAMGIAGTFSGGLMQYDHGGGSVKRIFCAVAASSGIQSALLAQSGITGPEGILEGERGLLKIYTTKLQPERLINDLGKFWTLEHVAFKPYSVVGVMASAIDGVSKIAAEQKLRAGDIESIEVGYATSHYEHAGITRPHDLLGMQFSTAYSLALTVLKGSNTPREYTMENLNDSEIRKFAERVHVVEDAELGRLYEGKLPGRVKLKTKSGKLFEELVVDARGSPGAPMSSRELDDKFRSQVAPVLGNGRCEELLSALRNVDVLDDMAKLPRMLVAGEVTR
jgi:2-methylcitrate dehydratase PrpD